jgi:hypothetical protein
MRGVLWSFGCRDFFALGSHLVCRVVPGWPAQSGSFEIRTSRFVGKQGERDEAKVLILIYVKLKRC